ncbi:MAG: TetR family transcriptional regulator C-terminal domain-containing protein, partial [Clostridia bacterium]|nr:TetR family transcriptional regulator C-terminal domain-containing protein [Clostridia bacterium]
IKKICETADVNRSTFYNHYDTQYALYDDILNDVSSAIGQIVKQTNEAGGSAYQILTNIFQYAENNRDLILVILSTNSNLNLGEAFTKNVNQFLSRETNSELFQYCTQFIAAGIANILWIWLNEENRRSAKEIAMVLYVLMKHGFKKASLLAGNGGLPPMFR